MNKIESKIDFLFKSLDQITSEEKLLDIFNPIIDEIDNCREKNDVDSDHILLEKIALCMNVYDHLDNLVSGINFAPNVKTVKQYFIAKQELAAIAVDLEKYPVCKRIQKESRELDEKFQDIDCTMFGQRLSGLEANPPECLCGKEMVLRRNRTSGEYFWGCSNFPNCRSTKQI